MKTKTKNKIILAATTAIVALAAVATPAVVIVGRAVEESNTAATLQDHCVGKIVEKYDLDRYSHQIVSYVESRIGGAEEGYGITISQVVMAVADLEEIYPAWRWRVFDCWVPAVQERLFFHGGEWRYTSIDPHAKITERTADFFGGNAEAAISNLKF